jgi:hypothetical protein
MLMGNLEDYNAKLPEITVIKDEDIFSQSTIPIEVYLQEAENVYKWCQADKEALIKAMFDWNIVVDLPTRAGALRQAVSNWVAQRFAKQETGMLWKEKSVEIFHTRNMLLHEFRFAYRKNTDILGRINAIAGSQSYAALIQDLNDFAVLGKSSPAALKGINFDMTQLDKAAQMAKDVAGLLAQTTIEGDTSAAKKIRDQAFTYLKMGVDELCDFGQYLFWKDDARKRGYSSPYLRRVRKRRTKTENAAGNGQETADSQQTAQTSD